MTAKVISYHEAWDYICELLKHINKYPKSNQNSILRNTFDDSISNYEQILKSDEYSWDVKKILAKYNKFFTGW